MLIFANEIQTSTKMKMKKSIISFALMLFAISASAQSTARKFVLKNSTDGQSELTCYLPKKPTGRAVVDCPGGGYSHLAMDHEGHQWAEYFNKQGIAYFVLKYRMPKGDRNIPLSDAYQAMRTVRDSAEVWHINKKDVGIMGFFNPMSKSQLRNLTMLPYIQLSGSSQSLIFIRSPSVLISSLLFNTLLYIY
jgi:hypothetical protein